MVLTNLISHSLIRKILCTGTVASLLSVVMVDILGVDNIEKSLGNIEIFTAMAFMIASPMAGIGYICIHSLCKHSLGNIYPVVENNIIIKAVINTIVFRYIVNRVKLDFFYITIKLKL